jgi:hypothetical protein
VEELAEMLADRALSDSAKWLTRRTDLGARETLLFLERAFIRLSSMAQRQVRKQCKADCNNNVDDFLHELLLYEVCYEFGLHPHFEPKIEGQTPDFELRIDEQTYIADVFRKNRPMKTIVEFSGSPEYEDCGEAAKKIPDAASKKAIKYRSLHPPLILFVVFANHHVGTADLETALYGATVNERLFSRRFDYGLS